jgi:putative hemolysin
MKFLGYKFFLLIFFLCFFSLQNLRAEEESIFMANPAAKYCEDLGYQWKKEITKDGEIGICVMPDGSTVEEWAFLRGEKGEEWSYCRKKGYKLKRLEKNEKCYSAFSENCAVCVKENGEEKEVSALMKLENKPEECQGGACQLKEPLLPAQKENKNSLKIIIIAGACFFVILSGAGFIFYKKYYKQNRE